MSAGKSNPRESGEALAATLAEPAAATRSRARASISPDVDESLVGHRLDHFLIERELGRGGMGAVYLAHDTSLDRRVAIKVLADELVDDEAQEQRFLREARAQARLKHPNVVHIHFIGHRPAERLDRRASLYFAMELVEGEPLEAGLERGEKLDAEEARLAMLDAATGLRAAYRAGIVHRDVKPSNLLRDADGYVKIADFGLAKPMEGDAKITQEGALVGSPLYMAPEQARGERTDHRTDMYSLGATFYHLVAGSPVFDAPSPMAVIARHLSETAKPLVSVTPNVPHAFAAIIDRLLEKDPARRYETYDALIADLVAAAPTQQQYAGFFTRAGGVLIDSGIASLCVWLWGPLPGLLLHLVHVTAGHAWRGQTLAKYFLRIRVQRVDGSPIGPLRATLRTFSALWFPFYVAILGLVVQGVPGVTRVLATLAPTELDQFKQLAVGIVLGNAAPALFFFGGLAVSAFHPQKRALHDLLVGTTVVYQFDAPPTSRKLRPSELERSGTRTR